MEKILVTAALPYANGPIHIGHLVEYVQADVFVRFLKSRGKDAIYCCADDTHGTPIEINARKQGITPEKLVEKYHKEHEQDFKDFLIAFDSYYSTNSPENKRLSDHFFNTLKSKNLIYTKTIDANYCEKCKRFLPDRFIRGKCPKCGAEDQYGDVCEACGSTIGEQGLIDPHCSICQTSPVNKATEHYFFKLGEMSPYLDSWLKNNKNLQDEVKNYVLNWIEEGLQDWCISRNGPYFGFKIPGEEDKYYYVWLDAPIGYISSTENYCKQKKCKYEDYWKGDSRIIHFIGKDIIYFHFLFWPAMLHATGFNMPENIAVHGFLTVNGEKMSKSRGTFITARKYLEHLDPEYLRYYFASNLSNSMSDINLDFDDFKARINNELVATIANFCYRTLSFTQAKLDGELGKADDKVLKDINTDKAAEAYESYNFRQAVQEINRIAAFGNQYFQEKQPWKMNDEEEKRKVLTTCANIVKDLAILIQPILPRFSEDLFKQLNIEPQTWKDLGKKMENHKINKPEILVKKIEKELDNFKIQEPFAKLNIKVAKIEKVEEHPDADKLYVMQVDLGKEKRQLVGGLREYYKPEELLGKHICVLTNLKPAKLRGVESRGMLLAAEKKHEVGVLLAQKSKLGDQVFAQDIETGKDEITYKQFQNVKIKTNDNGIATVSGKVLKTKEEEIKADKGLKNAGVY